MYRAFGEGCCSWQWILSAYSGLWSLAADVAASSMPRIVGAVAVNTALPVSPEMTPGSAFLSALNSSSNLEREMSAVPLRAGIVSTARNFYWGGAFRAAFPDQGDLLAYWRDAARIGMEAYAAYIFAQAPSEDWWAFEIASQMMTAAYYLWVMDEWWCQSVSVVGGGVCWVNDTLVPQWSQTYPGGVYIDTGWEGPAHTQETRMSDALLDRVLTNYMSIPRRPSPPPSSASTVFYDDVGFGGGSFRGEGALAFVGWEWNDRVSSIHVPSGRTVVLYEHADFDGETLTITGDDADLRQHAGPGPDGTWNDVVSSVRVYRPPRRRCGGHLHRRGGRGARDRQAPLPTLCFRDGNPHPVACRGWMGAPRGGRIDRVFPVEAPCAAGGGPHEGVASLAAVSPRVRRSDSRHDGHRSSRHRHRG